MALMKNNAIWLWNPRQSPALPTKIERQDKYLMVAAGAEFTIALTILAIFIYLTWTAY